MIILKTGFDYNNQEVTIIPDYAFYCCEDLKSVDCFNLTSIGASAFENCTNLKSVVLYDGIEYIGENSFKGCNNLTIYCMFENQPNGWNDNWNSSNCEVIWLSVAIETWDISATDNDNVVAKLYNDANNEGMYYLVISGEGNMKDWYSLDAPGTVTLHAPWYSYREEISNIIINKKITNIGDYAFYYCKGLLFIHIPCSVKMIGGTSVFKYCTNLKSVYIENGITVINNSAFSNCESLECVHIPNSVTKIWNYAFNGCSSLTSVTIPNSVTDIGADSFSCNNLISIIYNGTISQWNTINLSKSWSEFTPYYTIHCTDGDIAKDGTITYH